MLSVSQELLLGAVTEQCRAFPFAPRRCQCHCHRCCRNGVVFPAESSSRCCVFVVIFVIVITAPSYEDCA